MLISVPPQKSICLIKCGKRSELAHYKVIMSCISQIYWPWKTPPMFNRKALTSLETVHCSTHLGKLNWVVLGSFLPHFLWHGTVILSMIFLAHAIEGDEHPSQRCYIWLPRVMPFIYSHKRLKEKNRLYFLEKFYVHSKSSPNTHSPLHHQEPI